MWELILAPIKLNTLGRVDIAFFSICAGIILAVVAIYFLIPVIKKKEYEQQRNNLRKREAAFYANKGEKTETDDLPQTDSNDSDKD